MATTQDHIESHIEYANALHKRGEELIQRADELIAGDYRQLMARLAKAPHQPAALEREIAAMRAEIDTWPRSGYYFMAVTNIDWLAGGPNT